ncbi:DNA repair protein UVH3 [Gracilariopsis chorda]|uniref:DNA repair protein UVH3 n=1 Tax=Gracilariopsis chorda TaxID=448386 RepID=A0A2V3IMA9_9FLOR|nr:DNA repair protein UVH3 [Gracilariopsis chorda]|eukprot:PXF43208.1 DNA repair protein UVH3 [Gracilariopsis chorda]
MGVHGLWELLAPVGHRVSNENVRNKILAVDVSIWLTQFVIAMRDPEGAKVRNSHLLGVFRRCIKLLFLSVKPVLIFDGATPAIKRRTLASRRAQREKHEAKVRRLAEKILVTHIKKHAVGRAIAGKKRTGIENTTRKAPEELDNQPHEQNVQAGVEMAQTRTNETTPSIVEEDEIQPIYSSRNDPAKSQKKFGVSASVVKSAEQNQSVSGGDVAGGATSDLDLDDKSEDGYIVLPKDLQDIDHEALVDLPAHVQSEIFKQVKHEQRLRHREDMIRQQNNPTEFSKTQIEGFLRRTALNRKISSVRNVLNENSGVNNRIASDSRRQFVLEEKEEPNNTKHDLGFSDSDDDIINSSSARNSSNKDPRDIMSRIRAANEDTLVSKRMASHNALKEKQKQKESKSGVGWASKVLSRHGGLNLSAILPGTGAYNKDGLSHSSEECEEVGDKYDEADDQLQTREVLRKESVSQAREGAMKSSENESDSDDIEWEDGAVQSDPEGSERDFQLSLSDRIQERRELAEKPFKNVSAASVIHSKPYMKSTIEERPSPVNLHTLSKEDVLVRKERDRSERRRNHSSLLEEPRTKQTVESTDGHSSQFLHRASMEPIRPNSSLPTMTRAPTRVPSENILPEHETALLHSSRDDVRDFEEKVPKENAKEGNDTELTGDSLISDPRRKTATGVTPAKENEPRTSTSNHVFGPTTDSIGKDMISTELASSRKTRADEEEERDIELAIALSRAENDQTQTVTKSTDRGYQDIVERERGPLGNEVLEPHTLSAREQSEVDLEADNEESRDNVIDLSEQSDINETTNKKKVVNSQEHVAQKSRREMSLEEMESLHAELEAETQQIRKQQMSHIGATERISDEMCSETRDLLKLFGIPYLEAPMEAEAQCAFLNIARIVDGIITEDSDAFLFGAHTVYRKLFADGRFAEVYEAKDIKSSLGLDRKHLIRLAYLLGSDYTPGVRGVGIVNAMEILEAFPGINGLNEFLEWTQKVTILDKEPDESVMTGTSEDAVRRRFCWKHRNMKRNWEIRDGFPNPVVSEAYLKPTVDESKGRFTWRPIDFDGLAKFCWEKFGWEQSSFESAVGPLKTQLRLRRGVQQTRIDEFFKPHRFAKIRSERLQQAVKGIAGEQAEELMATFARRVKRRRTRAMTYQPSSDFTVEEEEQMLKLLEKADSNTGIKKRRNEK